MTSQPYTQQLVELCAPGLATLVHPGDETAGIHPFPLALGHCLLHPVLPPASSPRAALSIG